MLRTSILRHEPAPEGPPPHFDWLLEAGLRTPDDARVVPTFRIRRRPDHLAVGETAALERIDDHRGIWLERAERAPIELNPPLGTATPVRVGEIRYSAGKNDRLMDCTVRWSQSTVPMTYRIETIAERHLRITRIAGSASEATGGPAR